MSLYLPFEKSDWCFFGDESGAKDFENPKELEKRYGCYTFVAIPQSAYADFKVKLPEAIRPSEFSSEQLNEVYIALKASGGFAFGVYVDMQDSALKDDTKARLESLRQGQKKLPKPESVIWAQEMGFAFFELLGELGRAGLRVKDCHLKFHRRSLKARVAACLPNLCQDISSEMKRIAEELTNKPGGHILSELKPQLIKIEEGNTTEPGIKVADLLGRCGYERLHGRISFPRAVRFEMKSLTYIMSTEARLGS